MSVGDYVKFFDGKAHRRVLIFSADEEQFMAKDIQDGMNYKFQKGDQGNWLLQCNSILFEKATTKDKLEEARSYWLNY